MLCLYVRLVSYLQTLSWPRLPCLHCKALCVCVIFTCVYGFNVWPCTAVFIPSRSLCVLFWRWSDFRDLLIIEGCFRTQGGWFKHSYMEMEGRQCQRGAVCVLCPGVCVRLLITAIVSSALFDSHLWVSHIHTLRMCTYSYLGVIFDWQRLFELTGFWIRGLKTCRWFKVIPVWVLACVNAFNWSAMEA